MNPPKPDRIPSDQFARCAEELRKLSLLFDEVHQAIEVTHTLETQEAKRALELSRADIQTAGYWLSQAIKVLNRRPSPSSAPGASSAG